ncbi:tumor necrosis factor receptor superfamily member 14-like isoform X2 [Micropterus salmoides]|uniref:tumor necrosis factor receptor superfamily member 14-like isoform X2 n=1 Tax=Micropterus salmoides TaxID=27706 RepID=UPI0018EB9036|nr:tumor necrosis factor receptor superfamily member 14-like isoform X2 [Micropterus salmoides]
MVGGGQPHHGTVFVSHRRWHPTAVHHRKQSPASPSERSQSQHKKKVMSRSPDFTLTSSQISVRGRLQPMKAVILLYKMMFRRKPLAPAALMILVMNVLRGHSLPCHRGEYEIGEECCPVCPAGSRVKTDCTEFTSTSCLPCTEGTFMNQPTGRKQCFPCSTCVAGSGLKIKTSCTTTSDAVCEPLEGFYCLDSTEDSCMTAQRHTSCQPGQYISQKGTAFTDTKCSDCSVGTFSDGTFTSCQPHTQCESINLQLLKAGTASTDAECGEQSSDMTGVVIAAAVVGGILFLLISGSVAIWYLSRKKWRLNKETSEWR